MIFLYNPQVDDLLSEPPHFKFIGRRALKKYGFFIEQSVHQGKKIGVCVDATLSAFIPQRFFAKLPKFLRVMIADFELAKWLKRNGLSSEDIILAKEKTNYKSDVLLAFSYKAAVGFFEGRLETFRYFGSVVFHLTHYFISTNEKAKNIRLVPNAYLAGDSDISDNDYFRRFFSWYKKPFVVLPFAVESRFISNKPFSERKSKAIATGSLHDLSREFPAELYQDFMNETAANTYHPMREALYAGRYEYEPYIDCRISYYRNYSESNSLFNLFKHFFVTQRKYFSIDIVSLYNDYRFAVVGEELSGFPALGAFEAISCGCVLIGDVRSYSGLGLEPGVHYIDNGGRADAVIEVLKSHNNEAQLEKMSEEARKVVSDSFSPAARFALWNYALKLKIDVA